MRLAPLAVCACVLVTGCSGTDRVPDPFGRGVAGSRTSADVVICDPTPSTCTRWVVLAPAAGVATSQLLATVAAAAQRRLGWKPSRYPSDPAWQGLGFDGKTSGDGGFVNRVSDQIAHAHGDLDVGSSKGAGSQIIAAMQANPAGVVVRIMHNR